MLITQTSHHYVMVVSALHIYNIFFGQLFTTFSTLKNGISAVRAAFDSSIELHLV